VSAPVDVLAVFDDNAEARMALAVWEGLTGPQLIALRAEVKAARAAIAELIEAADALSKCYPEHSPIYHVIQLRAALAAVSPK
jgi:hypothetical protein